MLSAKRANNLVEKIHEKTLRLLHNDYENRFNDLLETNNEVTFHVKNNQKYIIMSMAYQTLSQME